MNHRDKTFEGRTIRLDGNHYAGCVFRHCILETNGAEPFTFLDSEIVDCQFQFVGFASNTLDLMQAMANDPVTRPMVESALRMILTNDRRPWSFIQPEGRIHFNA